MLKAPESYLVITPVKRVSAMADAVSLGDENVEPYLEPGNDAISSLSVSFNRMRESLKHAMATIKYGPSTAVIACAEDDKVDPTSNRATTRFHRCQARNGDD